MSGLPPDSDREADIAGGPVRANRRLMRRSDLTAYSITSSARARNDAGIFCPIALAVVRLTTSSNLVGCSTGISPGLTPAQNFVDQLGGAPVLIREVRSVGYEAASLDMNAVIEHGRQPSAERKRDDARAVGGNKCIDDDVQCVRLGVERLEDGSDIFRSPDFEWRDFQTERAGHCLRLVHLCCGLGNINIPHDCQGTRQIQLGAPVNTNSSAGTELLHPRARYESKTPF